MNKHIIFDLDGTIINSKNEIADTYKKAIHKVIGQNFDTNNINYAATLDEVTLEIANKDIKVQGELKNAFKEIYDQSDYHETEIYEGMIQLLNDLKRFNYSLYIATNKRQFPTHQILKNKNIKHYFKDIICVDSIENQKLSKAEMIRQLGSQNNFTPNLLNSYIVGDGDTDIIGGNKASINSIAVSWGNSNLEDLQKFNPTYVVNSPIELYKLFKNFC